MIKRRLEEKIKSALRRSPSVAITGPRQVGKTTLALDIAEDKPSVYLDLENPTDILRAKDIEAFHLANREKLIILDEVQRLPGIFQTLRGIIDQQRRKGNRSGQFMFLGSASIDLLQQSGESLAGRIAYVELFPVNILEFAGKAQNKINELWLRGGFPESLLAANEEESMAWRQDFIRTYLERDIPQLVPKIPAETLSRFWTMLAHGQGSLLNAASLARSMEVSATTIHRYLDLMTELLLVRQLKPWTFNIGKRLTRSPKIYVRDSGIIHALLNIMEYNDLLGHPVVGGSWEGFVIENIMSLLPARVQPYFYRTQDGTEIDLVLEFSNTQKWAIEIKRSAIPHLSKGFITGCLDIKAQRKYIVYAGSDRFSLEEGVVAIPLPDLMDEIINFLQ